MTYDEQLTAAEVDAMARQQYEAYVAELADELDVDAALIRALDELSAEMRQGPCEGSTP